MAWGGGEVMAAQATPGSGGPCEDLGFFLLREIGGYLTEAWRGLIQALAEPLSAVWCAENSLHGGRGLVAEAGLCWTLGGGWRVGPQWPQQADEVSGL